MSVDVTALLAASLLLAALLAVLVIAMLRMRSAGRAARVVRDDEASRQSDFVATAMQEAVVRLREQEQAMQARAEASERLSSEIIASMTAGLIVVGADGTVRTLNPAARSLLDLRDRPDGSFQELLAPWPPLLDVVEECVTTARPIVRRSVAVATPARPTPSHLGVTASPVRVDADDRVDASLEPAAASPLAARPPATDGGAPTPVGAICLFTDLTAVVELEEQLRLKESLARLGELTAGIAHEFRNGLATIHGYARLLDPDALPEHARPAVQGIRAEADALGDVVTRFLSFARPTQLTLTSLDLRALVDQAADEVRREVRESGGSVRVLGEFGRVEGDEVLLRQALGNLCRNAYEACLEAGATPTVVIRGSIDSARRVARVSVTDAGAGFAPDVARRAFEPFFTTKAEGIGLGLALVQKIVVYHDGRVSVGNADQGGARVTIELPTERPTSERAGRRG